MGKVEIRIPVKAAIVFSWRAALGRSESMFFVVVLLPRAERIKGVRAAVRTVIQKLGVCLNRQFLIFTCGVVRMLLLFRHATARDSKVSRSVPKQHTWNVLVAS